MTPLLSTSNFRAFNHLLEIAELILKICLFFFLGVIGVLYVVLHYSDHCCQQSQDSGKALDFIVQYIFKRSKSMENLVLWLDRPCRTVIF